MEVFVLDFWLGRGFFCIGEEMGYEDFVRDKVFFVFGICILALFCVFLYVIFENRS